jgi:hypothetical protein
MKKRQEAVQANQASATAAGPMERNYSMKSKALLCLASLNSKHQSGLVYAYLVQACEHYFTGEAKRRKEQLD